MSKNTQLGNLVNGIFVNSTGNSVGVKTTTPRATLDVNGNIYSNDIWIADTYGILFGNLTTGTSYAYIAGIGATGASSYLSFSTNAGEKMRIDNNGNVGIGTTAPNYILDAYSTGASNARINIGGTTNFVISQYTNTSGTMYVGIDDSAGANFTGTAYGRFIYSSGAYPLIFNVNSLERMRVDSSGSVGINGAPNPDSGDTRIQINGGQYGTLNLRSTSVNASVRAHNPNGGLYVGTTSNHFAAIFTNDAERMRITSDGNVGIGTTTPLLTATNRGNLTINGSTSSILTLGVAGGYSAYFFSDASKVELSTNTQPMTFVTNGSERMRITSAGNVGIGMSSPFAVLTLQAPSTGAIGLGIVGRASDNYGLITFRNNDATTTVVEIGGNTSSGFFFNNYANTHTSFATNGSERMRITSSGNVGIGTSSPSYKLSVNGVGSFAGSGTVTGTVFIQAGHQWSLNADQSGGGSPAFSGSGFYIRNENTSTTAIGFTTAGDVLIGTTTNVGQRMRIEWAGGAGKWGIKMDASDGGAANLIEFLTGGSVRGSITTNGTSVAYNTSSDYRLKEDLKPINGLEIANKIKVYDYKWKASNNRMDGVIAHELAEVLPYAVSGIKDGKEMQGVDYSKIVPVLIKAIQELSAEINILKNK